jgi:hypothetical protein
MDKKTARWKEAKVTYGVKGEEMIRYTKEEMEAPVVNPPGLVACVCMRSINQDHFIQHTAAFPLLVSTWDSS